MKRGNSQVICIRGVGKTAISICISDNFSLGALVRIDKMVEDEIEIEGYVRMIIWFDPIGIKYW